jgi:PDZ domain-containing protein
MIPPDDNVEEQQLAADVPEHKWRRRAFISLGTLVALVLLFALVASFISVHKVAYRPGDATPAEDRVSVSGVPVYKPTGDVLFLTVSVDRLSLLEWLWVRNDPNSEIVPEDVAFPKGHKEDTTVNTQLMQTAKSNAELVALNYLGYDVYTTTGAQITSLADNSPSTGHLKPGDTIVAINGTAISKASDAITQLQSTTPGQQISLTVEDDKKTSRTETIVLGTRTDDKTYGFLGVSLQDRVAVKDDLPVKLSIDSGRVIGDSAGLAFTLAAIDDLTPGELTGGHRIAVTGTIALDGTVGAIGGVQQKVVAARHAKAEVMLVPVDNFAEAQAKAGNTIKVIAVKDLDDALSVLSSMGGNAAGLEGSAKK